MQEMTPTRLTFRRPGRAVTLAATLLGTAGVLSACGTPGASTSAKSNQPLHIYTSMPLAGSSDMTAVLNGEKLALQQAGGRAGRFPVELKYLDDTTRAA